MALLILLLVMANLTIYLSTLPAVAVPEPARRTGSEPIQVLMIYLLSFLLGQDQVQVAELVPEVALTQGFAVRDAEVLASGERLEHREVTRVRLV